MATKGAAHALWRSVAGEWRRTGRRLIRRSASRSQSQNGADGKERPFRDGVDTELLVLAITHRCTQFTRVSQSHASSLIILPKVALAQHTASMSTPTPSGRATPPVPQGAGNPIGTPVVAPTRSSTGKDGASSNLGTFGVSTFASCIAIQRD